MENYFFTITMREKRGERKYKARCRRKEEGVEIRNVIKLPPQTTCSIPFLSRLRLPSPSSFFTLDSLIIPHFHPPLYGNVAICIGNFPRDGRMGQGNQTATTLSLLPLPFPLRPPFFLYRLSSSFDLLSRVYRSPSF